MNLIWNIRERTRMCHMKDKLEKENQKLDENVE